MNLKKGVGIETAAIKSKGTRYKNHVLAMQQWLIYLIAS